MHMVVLAMSMARRNPAPHHAVTPHPPASPRVTPHHVLPPLAAPCRPPQARTLHRDLRRYNDIESKEEAAEESGWKLVHGDVFRPPQRAGLLAVYLGTGVQACTRHAHGMYTACTRYAALHAHAMHVHGVCRCWAWA